MAEVPPLVYILHGEDELAINQYVSKMIGKMGEPATAGMNISRLDGRAVTMQELETAMSTPPFLSKRRLVILSHPLARLSSPSSYQKFLDFLVRIQPFTALVLIEVSSPTEERKNKREKISRLEKMKEKLGPKALMRAFPLPQGGDMLQRVQAMASAEGVKMTPGAAERMESLVGGNPLVAEKEIQKLSAYVNFSRPIEAEDVSLLVEDQWQGSIFNLVDALGNQDTVRSLDLYHRQLEENDPSVLFGMMIRQFRLLILVKEALEEGNFLDEVTARFRIQSFIVDKLVQQARKFDLERLENIYHRLLDYDEGMKTSEWEPDTALEVLITEVTQKN